jgi:hypothetical protein
MRQIFGDESQELAGSPSDLMAELDYIENEGSHEWGDWDTMIQSVLNWLPLPKKAK